MAVIKKMETDREKKGKAFVHWKSWHEAYDGMVSEDYLEKLTLGICEKTAYKWPDNILVAKEDEKVIGFVGYGNGGEEEPNTGVIFALYILSEYYGTGLGLQLLEAGLKELEAYPEVSLWVLKDNGRAIRFYEKCGFKADGQEAFLQALNATEIRMVLKK